METVEIPVVRPDDYVISYKFSIDTDAAEAPAARAQQARCRSKIKDFAMSSERFAF